MLVRVQVPIVASTGGLVDTVKEGFTGFQMGGFNVQVNKSISTLFFCTQELLYFCVSSSFQNFLSVWSCWSCGCTSDCNYCHKSPWNLWNPSFYWDHRQLHGSRFIMEGKKTFLNMIILLTMNHIRIFLNHLNRNGTGACQEVGGSAAKFGCCWQRTRDRWWGNCTTRQGKHRNAMKDASSTCSWSVLWTNIKEIYCTPKTDRLVCIIWM